MGTEWIRLVEVSSSVVGHEVEASVQPFLGFLDELILVRVILQDKKKNTMFRLQKYEIYLNEVCFQPAYRYT